MRFRQSGGFAWQTRGCDLDDPALEAAESRALTALLERAGAKKSLVRQDPDARDAEVYELVIERDGAAVHIQLDEASLDQPWAELIEFLQDRSEPTDLNDTIAPPPSTDKS